MKRYVILISLFLLLILTTAACRDPRNESSSSEISVSQNFGSEYSSNEIMTTPLHIAVVLGAHSNSPVIDTSVLEEDIRSICQLGNSSFAGFVSDGLPYQALTYKPDTLSKNRTDEFLEKSINRRINKLNAALNTAVAKSEEVDTLSAIEMAARQLQSCQGQGDLELVVIDSGLSTVNPLDFSELHLDYLNEEEIVESLDKNSEIPDLKDVDVTWYQLGDTAAPQDNLTSRERKNLQAIWQAILERSGAKSITFSPAPSFPDTYSDLPSVKTVSVIGEKRVPDGKEPESSSIVSEPTEPTPSSEPITYLDEGHVEFKGNEAILKYPEDAKKAIKRLIADPMLKDETCEALLVGCTARYGELSGALDLSFKRAMVIKDILVELGVSENRITVIGTGWLSGFYTNDQLLGGGLDEQLAKLNRCCVWIDRSSDYAEQILSDPNSASFIYENH